LLNEKNERAKGRGRADFAEKLRNKVALWWGFHGRLKKSGLFKKEEDNIRGYIFAERE